MKRGGLMAIIMSGGFYRRGMILNRLRKCGAVSEETAKTLAEAGVPNPNGLSRYTERLVQKGVIKKTADGRYYL